MESIINLFDKYHAQIIVLLMGITFIVIGLIVWIWISNRRKYHNLKHQIPAYVVKNYLDSIIQNSSALKSSLFRGGGLDIDPSNIPSVMPVDQMNSNSSAAVDLTDVAGDEALKAELSRLQSQLATKESTIKELENKITDLSGQVSQKQARIEELEALLEKASAGGNVDEALKAELSEVKKERDELKEELEGYGMIQDDLANLKRLKQENAQLKAALEQSGGEAPPVAEEPVAEEPVAEEPVVEEPVAEEPVAEEPVTEEPVTEEPVAEEPVAEEPATEESEAEETVEAADAGDQPEASEDQKSDDKSPEDLLSEFEKMLG